MPATVDDIRAFYLARLDTELATLRRIAASPLFSQGDIPFRLELLQRVLTPLADISRVQCDMDPGLVGRIVNPHLHKENSNG